MVEWNPKDEMGLWRYLKFKLGRWVRVSTLPKWVYKANDGYREGYFEKHGHEPYDEQKVYSGDSLEYKIRYKTVGGQERVEEEYFTRIKP